MSEPKPKKCLKVHWKFDRESATITCVNCGEVWELQVVTRLQHWLQHAFGMIP